ncbi:S1/P1 nuclease [Paraglaciecola hydrolytica]|uniref:S1/P1 Nuclease n=1 Tax=Paraglaciecola hydrolytica TaxID=1799789 RepID=A0A136A4T8_9ALTE|nr:S1/P1 nuclease [Paraglaciecola hydrolytica]KXI30234.1 S1/P1 Nuclease [Paraglaciecola hydrolytica]
MKTHKIIILLASFAISGQVLAWGQNGHRITGAIAQQYLAPKTLAAVQQILPNEDLAEASTYADEMKSNPTEFWKKTANPWHYVTVPAGHTYHEVGAPEEGDAISALNKFTLTLKDPKATMEEKQLALRFIVHIIGDLHQPLHVGAGNDRGGNDVKLQFFWKDSNLHSVWDSGLIEQKELSYTEWTTWLSKNISADQAKQWMVSDPQVWINESAVIRDSIYPKTDKLSYDYLYESMPVVKQRLQMGGIRIAAYLNAIFK